MREDSGALIMVINSMLSRQEVSHQQVMSYLVGGGDHYASHRFRLLYFAAFHRVVRQFWCPIPSLSEVTREGQSEEMRRNDIQDGPLTSARSEWEGL